MIILSLPGPIPFDSGYISLAFYKDTDTVWLEGTFCVIQFIYLIPNYSYKDKSSNQLKNYSFIQTAKQKYMTFFLTRIFYEASEVLHIFRNLSIM